MKSHSVLRLTGVACLVSMLIFAQSDVSAEEKPKGETWQRILLEDKVFTTDQLKDMEESAALVAAFDANIRQGFFTVKIKKLPKELLTIDRVIELYGKPDKKGTGVVSEEEVDEYKWGRIDLITKKRQKGVIGLGTAGSFFLDGLKKSAERGGKPADKK